jgi:hypothetical protein
MPQPRSAPPSHPPYEHTTPHHKHALHGGVRWRGGGRQPLRQAATRTAVSASVYQPARAKPTSPSSPTSTSRAGYGTLFVIGIECVIPPSGMACNSSEAFLSRLATYEPTTPRHHPPLRAVALRGPAPLTTTCPCRMTVSSSKSTAPCQSASPPLPPPSAPAPATAAPVAARHAARRPSRSPCRRPWSPRCSRCRWR